MLHSKVKVDHPSGSGLEDLNSVPVFTIYWCCGHLGLLTQRSFPHPPQHPKWSLNEKKFELNGPVLDDGRSRTDTIVKLLAHSWAFILAQVSSNDLLKTANKESLI